MSGNTKSILVAFLFIISTILFIITAATYDFVYVKNNNTQQYGLFQFCLDAPNSCYQWYSYTIAGQTYKLTDCANGNSQFTSTQQTECQHIAAAEAFSILTILISFITILLRLMRPSLTKHNAAFSFVAVIFAIITFAIFTSTQIYDTNTMAQDVNNNTLAYSYSFGLGLAGIILQALGGFALLFI